VKKGDFGKVKSKLRKVWVLQFLRSMRREQHWKGGKGQHQGTYETLCKEKKKSICLKKHLTSRILCEEKKGEE